MAQGKSVFFILFFICYGWYSPVSAGKRIALVIGNSAYHSVGELANPVNDARLIARVLRAQKFEVIERLNLSQKQMKRAIKKFTRKLGRSGRDTIGFVFYAGHGLQINGRNYLVPVDAKIEMEGDVDIETISAHSLLFGMKEARNRLNVIVFDACRNNPYRSLFRSATRGLAQMGSPRGSLVAFSTAPGDVAADGIGKNSPYSATLAKFLSQPGLGIEQVFKSTRQEVYAMTKERQIPWERSSLIGNFYPAGRAKGATNELPQILAKAVVPDLGGKRNQQDSKPLNAPKLVLPKEQVVKRKSGGFDGVWRVSGRAVRGCRLKRVSYHIYVKRGRISQRRASGRRGHKGRVQKNGSFSYSGPNRTGITTIHFSGKMSGRKGWGRYHTSNGRCKGKASLTKLR